MKFVPSLGRALKEMILDGKSDFARPEFAITRKDKEGKGIVFDGPLFWKRRMEALHQYLGRKVGIL